MMKPCSTFIIAGSDLLHGLFCHHHHHHQVLDTIPLFYTPQGAACDRFGFVHSLHLTRRSVVNTLSYAANHKGSIERQQARAREERATLEETLRNVQADLGGKVSLLEMDLRMLRQEMGTVKYHSVDACSALLWHLFTCTCKSWVTTLKAPELTLARQ